MLRVFQHDAAVLDLFDRVVERWRLTGNTLLIAGTDLVDRTLDAGDVLTFLDRRLGERFVSSTADIEARIAEFDLQPDLEGRFRINECYCHDSTWRAAFAALAARSDVVLMDLRGFQARNEGCRHELASLAAGRAESAASSCSSTRRPIAPAPRPPSRGAPAQRFAWVDAGPRGRFDADRLLARLFAATPLPALTLPPAERLAVRDAGRDDSPAPADRRQHPHSRRQGMATTRKARQARRTGPRHCPCIWA